MIEYYSAVVFVLIFFIYILIIIISIQQRLTLAYDNENLSKQPPVVTSHKTIDTVYIDKISKKPCEVVTSVIDKFISNYSKPIRTPYIIGLAGGSGSGKSFLSEIICETIKKIFPHSYNIVTVISQDSYYCGGDETTNYDVPSAIDFDLLTNHIERLINGKYIECPIYNFRDHRREKNTRRIYPTKIIIVEGILIFTQEKLRNKFNLKIYVDATLATQVFRRIIRDTRERGRTLETIRERYERDVAPSYIHHIYPSVIHADLTINNFNGCYVGLEAMLNHVITILKNICEIE